MQNTKIYDVPTRLFHWLFAASFGMAFFIAKVFDDESSWYPYHMMLGLIIVLMVGFRILWGILGSRYARFSSFPLNLSDLIKYFKDLLFSKTERRPGANPASAWAALLMMGLALGLGLTGYQMTHGTKTEFFEEAHEFLANAFIFVVIAHIVGVVIHVLRHQDGLLSAMIHGNKESFDPSLGIQKPHAAVGFIFLACIGMFAFHLHQNYNPSLRTLKLFGTTFQMGESENEKNGQQEHENQNEEDDD